MIVAITGAIVGVGGLMLNLRGVRDQNRQQAAAEQALETKTRLDETQLLLDGQAKALERADTRERDLLARIDQLAERGEQKDRRIEQLEDELDEKDLLRRQQLSQQEARCREQTTALTDVVITLRSVVVDETAKAAAATVLDRQLPHPHVPPAIEGSS